MELDTVQKIIGIIGGLVAILGTFFSIWRDWPKVQERLQKRVSNQKPNDKALSKPTPKLMDFSMFFLVGGMTLFIIGTALLLIGGVLSLMGSFFTPFVPIVGKAWLTLSSGGCFFASIGFMLSVFESNTKSKLSDLLFGLLLIGVGFWIYSSIP